MNTVEAMMQREIERLTAENTQLQKDYTRIKESATLWHDHYKTKCQEYMDRQAILGAEIVALEAERDALKEQMTADRKQFLDMRNERDALAQNAERVRVYKQRYFEAIAERDALAGEKHD